MARWLSFSTSNLRVRTVDTHRQQADQSQGFIKELVGVLAVPRSLLAAPSHQPDPQTTRRVAINQAVDSAYRPLTEVARPAPDHRVQVIDAVLDVQRIPARRHGIVDFPVQGKRPTGPPCGDQRGMIRVSMTSLGVASTSITRPPSGNNSSIRLWGQSGSFSKVLRSQA